MALRILNIRQLTPVIKGKYLNCFHSLYKEALMKETFFFLFLIKVSYSYISFGKTKSQEVHCINENVCHNGFLLAKFKNWFKIIKHFWNTYFNYCWILKKEFKQCFINVSIGKNLNPYSLILFPCFQKKTSHMY